MSDNIPTVDAVIPRNIFGEEIYVVEHLEYFRQHIGSLYLNENYSDIILKVDGQHFPAHRNVLTARSKYFRALLLENTSSGSGKNELELKDVNVFAFKILLIYIYTGQVKLTSLEREAVLDLLGLAHKFEFEELEAALLEYLTTVLNATNFCQIFEASLLYCIIKLTEFCLHYADKNATEILKSTSFLRLSSTAVIKLVERDTFYTPEINVFRGIQEWVKDNWELDHVPIVSEIRAPSISHEDLIKVVWPSKLISEDVILRAMEKQMDKIPMMDPETRRHFKESDINIATPNFNAEVLEGRFKNSMINGDCTNYDDKSGYTSHEINDNAEGIIIQLGKEYVINHICFLLWDVKDSLNERFDEHVKYLDKKHFCEISQKFQAESVSYSYYIEISLDKQNWLRIIDYTSYWCRSWQNLFFQPKVVKYIRLVGTCCSINRSFHVVYFEAMHSTVPFQFENGLLKGNVTAIPINPEYCSVTPRCLSHVIGGEPIVVQLSQPCLIGSMQFVLWNGFDCSYKYFVEVSVDQNHWCVVADKRNELCKLRQHLKFDSIPASFIKITGTFSTVGVAFLIYNFECHA